MSVSIRIVFPLANRKSYSWVRHAQGMTSSDGQPLSNAKAPATFPISREQHRGLLPDVPQHMASRCLDHLPFSLSISGRKGTIRLSSKS